MAWRNASNNQWMQRKETEKLQYVEGNQYGGHRASNTDNKWNRKSSSKGNKRNFPWNWQTQTLDIRAHCMLEKIDTAQST